MKKEIALKIRQAEPYVKSASYVKKNDKWQRNIDFFLFIRNMFISITESP